MPRCNLVIRLCVTVCAAVTFLGSAGSFADDRPSEGAAAESSDSTPQKQPAVRTWQFSTDPTVGMWNLQERKLSTALDFLQPTQSACIGLKVAGADEALRSQLEIPEGRGLVVTQVSKDSDAEKAGLREHDVLLEADGKPLSAPEDLDGLFKGDKKQAKIRLLREGREKTIRIEWTQSATARLNTLFAISSLVAPKYRIGVSVAPASGVLRAQLKLPKDQGLVITGFVPEKDSPAEKAGLKLHDVLLSAEENPLKSVGDLSKAVQDSKGKPVKLDFVREGKRLSISVTPEKKTPTVRLSAPNQNLVFPTQTIDLNWQNNPNLQNPFWRPRTMLWDVHGLQNTQRFWLAQPGVFSAHPKRTDPKYQLDRMARQIEELRKSVESLRKLLEKQQEQSQESGSHQDKKK